MNSFENFSFEYGVSEQITPLVKRVIAKNPGPFTYTGTGTFIVGTKELAVIDPGPIDNNHLNAIIKACGKSKISHIIITHTHNDHSPLSKSLQKKTGAPIYSFLNKNMDTKTDNQFEEGYDNSFKPDIVIKDGDLIKGYDWTLEAIHTPGHTSNHMCYGLEEKLILFTGDHIMGWSTTVIVPPDGNMTSYIESLKKVLNYKYKIFYPTHGGPITKPKQFVNALIAHRLMRQTQIINELSKNNLTIKEMVIKFYKTTDKRLWPAAEKSILANLLSLKDKGVVVDEDNKKVKWKVI